MATANRPTNIRMRTMNPANLYARTPFSAMPPAYAQDPARLAALRMAAFLRQTPQTLYDVNNPQVLNRIRSEYGIDDRAWHQVATTIGGVSGAIYFGYTGVKSGAALGSFAGPVGTVVGGVVGGVIGTISGWFTGQALASLVTPSGLIAAGDIVRNVMVDIQRRPVEGLMVAGSIVAGTVIASKFPISSPFFKFMATAGTTRVLTQATTSLSEMVTGESAQDSSIGTLSLLNAVGNTLDNFSGSSALKAALVSMTGSGPEDDFVDVLTRAYGTHEQGFTQLDSSRIRENLNINWGVFGNAIVDFAGEILLDPSNWVQWSAASVEKQFTEAVDQYMALEQLAVKPDAGLRYEFLSKLDKIDRMRLGQYLLEHHANLAKMEGVRKFIGKDLSSDAFNKWRSDVLARGGKFRDLLREDDNGVRVYSDIEITNILRDTFDSYYQRTILGIPDEVLDTAVKQIMLTEKTQRVYDSLNLKNIGDVEGTFKQAIINEFVIKNTKLNDFKFRELSNRYVPMKHYNDIDDLSSKVSTAVLNPVMASIRNIGKIKRFLKDPMKQSRYINVKEVNGTTVYEINKDRQRERRLTERAFREEFKRIKKEEKAVKDALRAELQANYDKSKQEIYDRRISAIEKLTEQKAAIYREYQETYNKLEELRSKRNLIKYGPDAMVPNEFSEANIELAKQINKELHKVIKKGQATEAQKAEFNKNAELISDYSKYSTYRENYVDTEQKVQLLNTLSRLAEVEYNYIMNSGYIGYVDIDARSSRGGEQATAPERHNIPKELADAYAGFLKHHYGVSDTQFKEIGSIFAEINLAGIPPKITVDGAVVDNPEYLSLRQELASRIASVFNDDIGYVIDPDTQKPKIVNGFKQIATHIWVDPQGNKHLIPRSPANVAHSMVTYYENIIAPKMGTFLSVNNLTSYQLRNAVYDKMTTQFTEFRNKFLSQIVPIYSDLKDQRDAFVDLDTEYAKRLSQTLEHIERDLVVKFIRGDYEVNNNFVDGKIDYDVSPEYLLKLIDGDPENGIEGLSETKARIVNEIIRAREESRLEADTVSVSPADYIQSFDEIETNSEFADIALNKHPSITVDSLVASEGLPDTVVDQIDALVQTGLYDDNPEALGRRTREIIQRNREQYRETLETTQDEVVEVSEVDKLTKLINNRRLLNKDVTDVFQITELVRGYVSDDVRYTINKGTAINQYDNETFTVHYGDTEYTLNKGAIIDVITILKAHEDYLDKFEGTRDQPASPALDFNVDHYVDLNSDGEYYHETIGLLLGGTTSELLGTGVLYDMIEDVFDRAFDGKTIETIILDNIQNSFTDAYGTIYIDNVEYSKDKTTLDFIEEFGVATDIREARAIIEYLKSMPTEDLNSYGVLSQIKKLNKIVDRVKQNHSYLITSQSITQTEQALDLVVKDSLDQLFYVLSGDNTSFRINAPKDMVPYIIEALNTIPAIRNPNVDDSDTNYTKLLNKLTEVRLVHDFIREASDVFDFTGGYRESGAYRGKFFDIMNNLSNNRQWFEVDSNGRLVVSDEDFERTFKAKSERFTTEEHKQLLDYFLNKIRSMRADLVANPETSQFKMFNFGAQMDSNFVRNISDYFKNWVDKLEVVSNKSSNNPLHREDLNAARAYLKELFAPMRQALARTKNTNDFLKQFLFTGEFVRPLDFNYSKLVENDSPIVLRSTHQERITTRMQKNVRDYIYKKYSSNPDNNVEFVYDKELAGEKVVDADGKTIVYLDPDDLSGLSYDNMSKSAQSFADSITEVFSMIGYNGNPIIPNMATLDRFVRLFDELKGKSPNSDMYQLGKFVYDHLVSTGNIQETSMELIRSNLDRSLSHEGAERAGANHSQTYGPDFGEDRTKALIGLFMMEYTDDPQISIQNYRAFREKQIAEVAELDKAIEAIEKSLKQTETGKVHRSVFTVMSQLPFDRIPDYMRLTYGISISQSSLDAIAALRYFTTRQLTEGYTIERIVEIESDLLNQDRARVHIMGGPYDLVTLVRNKISTEIYNADPDKYEALGIQKKSKTRSDFTMMKLYEEYNELLKDPNADPVRLTEIKHELESIRKSAETDTDVLVEQLSEENTTIEAIDAEIERIGAASDLELQELKAKHQAEINDPKYYERNNAVDVAFDALIDNDDKQTFESVVRDLFAKYDMDPEEVDLIISNLFDRYESIKHELETKMRQAVASNTEWYFDESTSKWRNRQVTNYTEYYDYDENEYLKKHSYGFDYYESAWGMTREEYDNPDAFKSIVMTPRNKRRYNYVDVDDINDIRISDSQRRFTRRQASQIIKDQLVDIIMEEEFKITDPAEFEFRQFKENKIKENWTAESVKINKVNNIEDQYILSYSEMARFFTKQDGLINYEEFYKYIVDNPNLRFVAVIRSNHKRTKYASNFYDNSTGMLDADKENPYEATKDTNPYAYLRWELERQEVMKQENAFMSDNPDLREIIVRNAGDLMDLDNEIRTNGDLQIGIIHRNQFKQIKKTTMGRYKLPPALDYYYRNIMRAFKLDALTNLSHHFRNITDMIFKNISMSNGPSEFSEVFNNTADTFALHRTWDNYDKEIYELKKDVVSAYSEYKRNGTAPSDEQMKIWELDMRIRKQSIDKELESVTNNKVKRSLQKQKASIDIALDTNQDIGVRLASIHDSYVTLGYMGYVRQRYHQKVSLETTIKVQDTDSIEWIVYEKIRKRKFFREATPDRQELIFKIAVDDYLSLLNEVNEFAKSEALSQIERDLINNRHRYEEENKETELRWDEQMFRVINNTLVHTSLLQKVGGPAEFVGRLQNYLYQRRVKGRTENEAIADVVDRHFNYSDRSPQETWAEIFFPFMMFPTRNALFWSKQFSDGKQVRFLHAMMNAFWGSVDKDDRETDYAKFARMSGWVPIGDTFFKVGHSGLDAFKLTDDPFEEAYNRLNPLLRQPIEALRGNRTWGEATLGMLPILRRIPDAMKSQERIQEGQHTLREAIAPSLFAPFRNRGYGPSNYGAYMYRNIYQNLYNSRGTPRPIIYKDGYQRVTAQLFQQRPLRYGRR